MTARSMRRTARNVGLATLAVGAIALVISIELFRQGRIGAAFEFLAAFAYCLAGYFAFQVPAQCGVITTKGHPCRNEAYGVLIGCHAGNHARMKLLTRLHWERAASRAYGPAGSAPGRGPVVVVIRENGNTVFDICMSVASLLVAVISTIAGIIH